VEALQAERQLTEDRLVALQATAMGLEDRLEYLETSDPAAQLALLQAKLDEASESQQLSEIQTSLRDVQGRVDGFQATLDQLSARVGALDPASGEETGGSLAREDRLPVARQKQTHNLSCESSAASMVAAYHGVNLTEADALAAIPLDDNPHLGFRGNVDGPTGGIQDYGVYAGPILDLLASHGLSASLVEGGLEGVRAATSRGNPVIAWVTYNCLPSTPTETTIGGQSVKLVPNQHVVVVTGFNAEGFWANDPWDGKEDFYPNADFDRAMAYFDYMAIEVGPP
jgi:bifunctional autolysin